MEYQIITKNSSVNSSNKNVYFIEGNFEDVLVKVRSLEKKGIKTVLIIDEFSERDGMSQHLADTAKEAIVC